MPLWATVAVSGPSAVWATSGGAPGIFSRPTFFFWAGSPARRAPRKRLDARRRVKRGCGAREEEVHARRLGPISAFVEVRVDASGADDDIGEFERDVFGGLEDTLDRKSV